ncbi:probable low-specificity L-threonine aldolase 2 [Teleopsis dalmanni]|uniref:probable low-specificity L-threonine aldolase 2 n=1 Tax=Teleopsis dalmanni TaxID=139649 RepID=UPI0018CCB671|nr:probable low-specificity L-threonine aldolase 2 [Teleopsis dalmanni]
MRPYTVDVRSDTVTQPTSEMRQAMAEAEVGDDVFGEDPTIKELQDRSARLFDKEAALFVPSGTMANLIAIMVHCHHRGAEAIVGDLSHTFLYEQGGAAQIGGVQLATIKNEVDGTFSLSELRNKIRYDDCHEPITCLVSVENTHNMCGGKVLPLEWLNELVKVVKDPAATHSPIALHMDGARIFNAAAALKIPVARITRDFDSVCYCLSKGLSAPVGSVLMGSKAFIAKAHRLRKALGGGMRQAGILAAAGLVGLETVVPRLSGDHQRTKRVAEAVHNLKSPNFTVDLPNVQTNILLIDILNSKLSSNEFCSRLKEIKPEELEQGVTSDEAGKVGIVVQMSSRNWKYARAVFYHQNTDKDIDMLIKKLTYVIKEFDSSLTA